MPVTLLATKLYIPPLRPTAVSRPRLIEKLAAGLGQPGQIVLLSGPAGFGKTTLLSEYIARHPLPLAWVSLDDGDNDPIRFWTYVIKALQSLAPGLGEAALALFRAGQPLPAETVPGILINDLAGAGRDLILVLDDFHLIQDQGIQAALIYLLEHMPGNLDLIISTRVDPPWPLARFRARNRLTEVRVQDLRFLPEEALAFFNNTMNLDLSAQDVKALEARTEGWIAGLQLAALSMQGHNDMTRFVKDFTGSHVYIAEYLVEEVLQRQPEEVQAFLLQTSILERLNGDLVDAVCAAGAGPNDCPGGQAVLEDLQRANLFVLPLDDERRWFRYHHLFADLLRARLRQVLPPAAVAALHQHASAWYHRQGLSAEAVNHALAARDFEAAAQVVEQVAAQMITQGELVTLRHWTEALPGEVVEQHPQIIIAKVWALALAGAVAQVEPLLQFAEQQTGAQGDTAAARELVGFAAAIRALFAMMAGEDARALELAQRAEMLLPESSVHARWLLPYTFGSAYRGQGQYEQAVEAFTRQAQMGEAHDNLVVWGTGITGIALARHAQGLLREVSEICRLALERLEEQGAAQFGSLAKLEVPLIEALIEQNELEEAQRRLVGVQARMQHWPMPTDRLHADLALIQLQEAQGDLAGASETLRRAKELKTSQPVFMNLARQVDLFEVRLLLKKGELSAAEGRMTALRPAVSRWVELRDQELLLLARLRLAQQESGEADRILSALAEDARAGARKATLIESLILRARVLDLQDGREEALAALSQALALAEPQGFMRVFVAEGAWMQRLLDETPRQRDTLSGGDRLPSTGYLARLLGAFGEPPVTEKTPLASAPASGLVEPLTPRELDVLRLIAAGDSNRAIAEKLVITVSAVKKHTGNIYGKLSVNSRTQAVARARQLGLLSTDI